MNNHRIPSHTKPSYPQVSRVSNLLDKAYLPSNLGNKSNPLDELIYVMLSGQTSEKKYQSVFKNFKMIYPKWSSVPNASQEDIEKSIWHAGLAKQKASYIYQISQRLLSDFGEISLRFLKKMDDSQAEDYLMSLAGIGLKTARCTLMYSLNREVFPADVHCLRIMFRLNWINSKDRESKYVANQAQEVIPSKLRKNLHIRFVQHGRAICRPRPKCEVCCLHILCPNATI